MFLARSDLVDLRTISPNMNCTCLYRRKNYFQVDIDKCVVGLIFLKIPLMIHFCSTCKLRTWRVLKSHKTHHIGLQKQFVQLLSPAPLRHVLLIFTFGLIVMHAKQELSAFDCGAGKRGFLLISSLNTATNRSIIVVWNLTDDNTVMGRFMRSWRSRKSREFMRILKDFMPLRVGLTSMLTNCAWSFESWIEMLWVSVLTAIRALSLWCAKIIIVKYFFKI